MRTKLTIVAIVMTCLGAALGASVALTIAFGLLGLTISVLTAVTVITAFVALVRPWHSRWGSTDEEVARTMPGDEVIPAAASTTRAITVQCPPEQLWPWLAQLGYGRAGWYSYDWIDNDGRASADRVIPDLQDLRVGDTIQMLPGWGPQVAALEPPRYFLAGDAEEGTWCLAIYPVAEGCRLVSRWRQNWTSNGLASWFFISIADPGAFLMEQKMLREIKRRAEASDPIRSTEVAALVAS